ncbi:hypothetical protein ILUMI_22779 [Ignelater luminosus]|uniref:Uncharacterized protein n=1 Tax=Ignelater luminosus TaxID=2038154 RepID=A0A8K0CDS4_IGNLU|nr:hypothetical protein ILUMI_22779 [Ignelater luminosus]
MVTPSNVSSQPSPPVLDIKNLSIIPNFDGNVNKLHRFINAVESILNHYYDDKNLGSFQNVLLLNGILNKLEGRAEEVIAIYGCDSWKKIKETLLQNFGDQRDENCLNHDLVNLRQKPGASQILNRPVTQIPQFRPSHFPQGPVNIQRNPNSPARKFPTNSQVFGKPTNVRKPGTNIPTNRPTPMSISTRNTSHVKNPNPVNAFQNYGQKPKVISEELFNTEFDDQSNNNLEYVYDNQQAYETCYVDDEHCEDSEYENFPQDPDINIPT